MGGYRGMKTNKLIGGCVMVLFLFGPTFAVSTVTITPGENPGDPGYGFLGGGGEMWTHVLTGSLGIYGPGDSFATFCVEIEEPINFADPPLYTSPVFDAVVNPLGAVQGGLGGSPDPISDHTAWLYLQFVTDNLGPYEYDGTVNGGANRTASAKALQWIFWGLEYELDPVKNPGEYYTAGQNGQLGGLQQVFFDLADTAVTGGWQNNGRVQAVNITDTDVYGSLVHMQDILVMVPAPGAIGLALFGIGLFGYLKRRRSL